MIECLINRYKSMRMARVLHDCYHRKYAVVGMGNHSLSNIYPVLQYLQVNIKYICVTNEAKRELIAQKYLHSTCITDLDIALADPEIAGVIVCASPSVHYPLAQKILNAGKHLLIEKPPCQTGEELAHLAQLSARHNLVAMAGLQKRYAPHVQTLKHLAIKNHPLTYHLRYCTGTYTEGDVISELWIHPIDLAVYLFGKANLAHIHCTTFGKGRQTVLLTFEHDKNIAGTLELSTAYSWTEASEHLQLNTTALSAELNNMYLHINQRRSKTIFGIPTEKVLPRQSKMVVDEPQSDFLPIATENQLVRHGFYGEIRAFLDAVERNHTGKVQSAMNELANTYELLQSLRKSIT